MSSREHLPDSIKKQVAGKQFYKCANGPDDDVDGLKDYDCPLWCSVKHNGSFDEAGFDIDHIEEYCLTQDHSMDNLQALCRSCHMVKTKRFMNNHKQKKRVKKQEKKEKEYNDIYERFLDECTMDVENKRTDIDNIYETFVAWWDDNDHGDICPGKRKMMNCIRKYKKVQRMTINKKWQRGIDNLEII